MGLIDALAGLASRRLHVLVVECPGAWALRAAAEQQCRRRGWSVALFPAEADALLVCGTPADERLTEAVAAVWNQLPGPRARAEVGSVVEVPRALAEIEQTYRDGSTQRVDAASRKHAGEPESSGDESPGSQDGDSDVEHGPDMGHGPDRGHDSDMSHDMEHDMDMSGPGGIPLASGAEDRDGLEMDVLHLRLGPVLPAWPAGLVAEVTLSGDVVTEVAAQAITPISGPAPDSTAAYRADAAARVLDLAGLGVAAARLSALRDHLLFADGPRPDEPGPDTLESGELGRKLAAARSWVSRSVLLRWSLRGLGLIDQDRAADRGWPAAWCGDAYDRLLRLLDPPTAAVPDDQPSPGDLAAVAHALPDLLGGVNLATTRLVVASLVGHAQADRPIPSLADREVGT